ncbi:MAG: citramalate synthase [bacterium]|nr:citramalate synthase [bacterium]
MSFVEIYDTTLRDGSQMEGISFSVADKIRIARKFDEMDFDYVEGGWPFSNPKDLELFEVLREKPLKNARLAAFGMTRRPGIASCDDSNIMALLSSGAPVVTIFGKTWDLHVREALKTTLDENLSMIADSVSFLVGKGRQVIFDAEHFFDGYADNPDYALKVLEAAAESGASTLVMCDTNGGSLPVRTMEVVSVVRERFGVPLGIHTHNDSGLAVANTLVAVGCGVTHIQGTVNGFGERCGNADLCSIIPCLGLKMGLKMKVDLEALTSLSHYVYEIANIHPDGHQPFVGNSAFAHKGGVHVSAVSRSARTYEHIAPEKVGNKRRILISELSGKSNVLHKAEQMNADLDAAALKKVMSSLVKLEHEGYQFEGAEASFEILILKANGKYRKLFDLEGFRVIIEKRGADDAMITEATIKVRVGEQSVHTVAEGDGPVHALDNAMRKALLQFYPSLSRMKLTDYKVRVIDETSGTAAKVRVLVESSAGASSWGTVGVSENIIEASWLAIVDSIAYALQKEEEG